MWRQGVSPIDVVIWIVSGVAVWLVVGTVVGLVLGWLLRRLGSTPHTPVAPVAPVAPQVPEQRPASVDLRALESSSAEIPG